MHTSPVDTGQTKHGIPDPIDRIIGANQSRDLEQIEHASSVRDS